MLSAPRGMGGTRAAALLPALVLAVLGAPPANLSAHWDSLAARSLGLLSSGAQAGPEQGGADYLLGLRRLRRLYCNVGIGFHLRVLPGGRIAGVHADTADSLLELSPVQRGVVSIFGVASGYFVAMDRKGRLYGSPRFTEECTFREMLLPNNYNAYQSHRYPGLFIALSKNGRTKRGDTVSPTMKVTHFLPRL